MRIVRQAGYAGASMVETTDGSAKPADKDTVDKPEWDDMVEDVFGLNIRAGKTVWAAFAYPARVFAAARTPDWQGIYTPSFRVFFSLIALLFVLKFFWAGEDSMIRQSFDIMLTQLQALDPRLETGQIIDGAMNMNWVIYPFALAFWYILGAFFLRIWGKGTTAPTRIRLYFAGTLPSTVVMILVTMMTAYAPTSLTILVMAISLLTIPLIDGLTVWRGLEPVHTGAARLWRAALFGLVTFTLSMVSSLTSQFGAGIWIGQEVQKQIRALDQAEAAAQP